MDAAHGFTQGFRAMVPLWLGVVPFALAYAVLAGRRAHARRTQALSVLVFAGSAQFTAVGLFGTGAAAAEIVSTTFLLNVRHVLYGLSLGRQIRSGAGAARPRRTSSPTRPSASSRREERTFAFLLGAELSLFVTWNLATLGGALVGSAITDPAEIGLDRDLPPRLPGPAGAAGAHARRARGRRRVGLLAYGLSEGLPGGLPILVTGAAGSLLGAVTTRGRPDDVRLDDAAREVA